MRHFFSLLLITLCTIRVWAQDIPEPMNPRRLVNEYAGMLNGTERETLEQKLRVFNDSTSANFSFGEQEQYIKGFEAGLKVDVYTRKIPIMVQTPNTAFFINFYLGIEFGKRK